jgi:hypothetical protein
MLLLNLLFFTALRIAQGQSSTPVLRPTRAEGQQGLSDACKDGSGDAAEWMSRMRDRGIKSVGAAATFTWNSGVESVSVTNLSYYSTVVTLVSGAGSRLLDTRPDSDSFSKMLADAAGPVITRELQQRLPAELAKSRLTRARGSIVVLLFDDPCLPIKSQLGDLVDPDISPLLRAASSHNHSRFYALLQDGADVNAQDQKGLTPLMAASFAGNVDIAEALLKHGARVNEQDIDGRTALHYAAENRDAADVIRALLKAGGDVNLKSGPTAKYLPGATPLIIAASVGSDRAVELLLNAGSDPNTLTVSGLTALDVARKPPLGHRTGHVKIIEMLEHRLSSIRTSE